MIDSTPEYGLLGLFLSAFVSATLAPGGSEAVLAYLARSSAWSTAALMGTATLGNTLGAITTWLMGFAVSRRWPPERLQRSGHGLAVERVRRWGAPVLLLSWLPLVGDGFCFAAGWLRLSFMRCIVLIACGKALRYAAVVWLAR